MSRRQRQRRRGQRGWRSLPRGLVLALGGGLAIVLLAVLGITGWVLGVAASAPNVTTLRQRNLGAASVVYADDGRTRLGFIQTDVLRLPVPTAQIPSLMGQATVAIEDQRFYHHSGVDFEGLLRAAVRDITTGKPIQGGSTITMQLVRNLYAVDTERTLTRKIREANWALQLESKHSKAWILNAYLNSVPYGTVGGQTAVGVGAAAWMFFDRPVNQLNLEQMALLAGLPQAPSQYNPFIDPVAATARRNEVLTNMAKQHMISAAQEQQALQAPLEVHHNTFFTAHRESYFFDYVKQQLIDRFGLKTVEQGGLRVYTTVNLGLQQAARKAIANQLNQAGDPSSAIVTIDPSNGEIKAMASSASYGTTEFNYAAQGHRQPGSAFKPMVLLTAVRQGIDPSSTIYDSHELTPGWLPGYPTYGVQTYSHSYSGPIDLVQATLQSDNTVYAQLDADVGPDNVRQTAYDMGITTHLDGYPAEGLGGLTIGVSPLEMANAYATLADGGVRNTPTAIVKVVFPDGHSVSGLTGPRERKFTEGQVATVTRILEENIQAGTGVNANISCPAGGKTGTTSDFRDAWFVGYTPRLATAVWVGYPIPKPMLDVHGIQVQGGSFPALIWHDYMSVARAGYCGEFPFANATTPLSTFTGHFAQAGLLAAQNQATKSKGKKKKGTGTGGTPGNGAPKSGTTGPGTPTPGGNGQGGPPSGGGTGGAGAH